MSLDDSVRQYVTRAFDAHYYHMDQKNMKIARTLDAKMDAKGKITAAYTEYRKFDEPVSLGLLLALADFVASRKEFADLAKRVEDIEAQLDE